MEGVEEVLATKLKISEEISNIRQYKNKVQQISLPKVGRRI